MWRKIVVILGVSATAFAQVQVVIGTATTNAHYEPLDRYYNYSTHEVIYLRPEINVSGNITHLAYYRHSGTNTDPIVDVAIYMMHTTQTTLASGSITLPPPPPYQLVYSGTFPNDAGEGWREVTLTNPFPYNNTDNLQILIIKGYQLWTYGYPTWRYTTTSPVYRTRSERNDYVQPTDLSVTYQRPNIRLTLAPLTENDVGVQAILSPGSIVLINEDVTPQARVRNYGANDQGNFNVTCSILNVSGILRYSDSRSVTSLAAGTNTTVGFSPWTPTVVELCSVKIRTLLPDDENPENDRRVRATEVLASQPGATYLIITPDDFYDIVKPLADWRHKRGIRTRVARLSETGSTASSIKTYIQSAYNTWNPQPEYLLLVGSQTFIPVDGNTDDYYGDLGGDYKVEIAVGRLSANSASQCSIMVNKILGYERNPYMVDPLWFRKGVTIVREDLDDDDTIYWGDARYAYGRMLANGYVHIDSFSAVRGHNAANVVSAVNNGRTYLLYRGQGVNNWWDPFSVNPNATSNGYKLPVIVSGTCATIGLGGSPMVGETWVRVGTPTTPKGAVAFFGSTMSGGGIAFHRSRVSRAFFKAVFVESCLTLGKACKRGKDTIYTLFPANTSRYKEWNLLGDPGLHLWTGTPKSLTVSHPTSIPLGTGNFTVEVYSGGNPVPNALVCATAKFNSEVYSTGYTNTSGQVNLTVTTNAPDTIFITVSGHNLKPYEGYALATGELPNNDIGLLSIIKSPSYSVGISDSIGMVIKNFGRQPQINFYIHYKLRYDPGRDSVEYTESLDSAEVDTVFKSWTPQIGGDDTIFAWTSLFGDEVTSNDSTKTPVYIRFADDVGVTSILSLADSIRSGGWVIPEAMVKNFGASSQSNFDTRCEIFGTGGELRFSSIKRIDFLQSGDSTVIDFDMWVPQYAEVCTIKVKTLLVDDNPSNDEEITGRVVIEALPSGGPDGYGYRFVDSDVVGGPSYDWIDISSTGTPLTLSSGNWDDGFGKIPIGFDFSFYGIVWDSVFVGTNGFLSFGSGSTAGNSPSPNTSIPNTALPNNLVCAYWDDLHCLEAGRLRYQLLGSEPNLTLVVSWNNVRHYGSGDSSLSFQILLFQNSQSILFQYYDVETGYPSRDRGMSATVGIENGTGEIGLEYLYNGSPLGNRLVMDRAIHFFSFPGDVSVSRILSPPESVAVGSSIIPESRVKNLGEQSQEFPVFFKIYSGPDEVYSSSRVVDLPSGDSGDISFDQWLASNLGTYTSYSYTTLPWDTNPANDTASSAFTVTSVAGGDVGAIGVVEPMGNLMKDSTLTPKAWVKNFHSEITGTNFPVVFTISSNPVVYSDTETVVSLAPGESVIVQFAQYTASDTGRFRSIAYTMLAGDENSINDTASGIFDVFMISTSDTIKKAKIKKPTKLNIPPGAYTAYINNGKMEAIEAEIETTLTGGHGNLEVQIGYGAFGTMPATWTSWFTAVYKMTIGKRLYFSRNFRGPTSPGLFGYTVKTRKRIGHRIGPWQYWDKGGKKITDASKVLKMQVYDTPLAWAKLLTKKVTLRPGSPKAVALKGEVFVDSITPIPGYSANPTVHYLIRWDQDSLFVADTAKKDKKIKFQNSATRRMGVMGHSYPTKPTITAQNVGTYSLYLRVIKALPLPVETIYGDRDCSGWGLDYPGEVVVTSRKELEPYLPGEPVCELTKEGVRIFWRDAQIASRFDFGFYRVYVEEDGCFELLAETKEPYYLDDRPLTGVRTYSVSSVYFDETGEVETELSNCMVEPISSGIAGSLELPKFFVLYAPEPNPASRFNLRFGVPTRSEVSLRLYDASGRLVATLVSSTLESGYYEVKAGEGLPNGVYVVRFEAPGYKASERLILVR